MLTVVITSAAEKELSKIPKKKQKGFFRIVETLKEDPFFGKKLSGELKGYRSVRLWPYRIVYSVESKEKKVIIRAVRQRQEAYG